MIENGAWVEDNKKTHPGKPSCCKKNDNNKKNGAVGGIVHDTDNEDETGTMEYVLAVIDSNSNTTGGHDYFEPI